MTIEHRDSLRRIFGWVVSALLILAGICLMAACVGIYRSGNQPFSREAVAAAFRPIAVPVYLCLGAIAAGFLLELFLPPQVQKQPAEKQYELMLKRLRQRTNLSQCPQTLLQQISAQQRLRKIHKCIAFSLLACGCLVFLIYALNPDHFHQSQINDSMVKAMHWLIPCMVLPFGYGVFSAYFSRASVQKEIALLKTAPKAPPVAKPEPDARKKGKGILILRLTVLLIGLFLFAYGFNIGGTADVLAKAVNICTECVGLG